ncbi:hypothetical protein Patl1_22518 [Pistacia atlantica]|uniref:Uncharacterized protein n=1 Tax=Pistacia atlantica TaxID=434234 RepID=A0ACC0ZWK9_9ROSI|nr:hypothetical protein Patl1_22518 [Pistacia atlantica]
MISSVLDITGKGKLVFIVAALVLAVFAFFATLLVYWKGRSTGLPDEKPILNLELVHMRVTGKHLNMVIDLKMVNCYEKLFMKVRDEMFQAMEELWGDRPRWNVRYLDISDEAHYLREDEISWG